MVAGASVDQSGTSGRRPLLGPLWLQVMVGIVLGVAIGVLFPHAAITLKPLGDGFVKLIRMTLAPIIFATVVVGIARMGDMREVGRVGAKALIYFEVVSTLALLMGLVAANVLHPGSGMNIDAAKLDPTSIASYTATAQQTGVVAFLLGIIPSNIGEPFVTGNILQIIVLGVLFGLALTPIRATAKPLVDFLDLLLKGMFGIVSLVMTLAPLAALGAMAYTVGQYGIASLRQLATFTAEVWIVATLFVVIVLGAIARLAGFSLIRLLVYIRDEILITADAEARATRLRRARRRNGDACRLHIQRRRHRNLPEHGRDLHRAGDKHASEPARTDHADGSSDDYLEGIGRCGRRWLCDAGGNAGFDASDSRCRAGPSIGSGAPDKYPKGSRKCDWQQCSHHRDREMGTRIRRGTGETVFEGEAKCVSNMRKRHHT